MRKIIFLIVSIGILSGCSSSSYTEYKKENPDAELGSYGNFKIVDNALIPTIYDNSYVDIVQDNNTGCMYIVDKTSSNPITISPLYDETGQVKGCGK